MKTKYWKKTISFLAAVCLSGSLLAGCGSQKSADSTQTENSEKTFVFGDTTFNPENEEADVNPHNTYAGWACIRYGIGETLFHYSDAMEIEPWLATEYENPDDLTWIITLRDDVSFSSGRKMDGEAVKECLEHLIEVHERARGDLMIDSITAEGQTVTIKTQVPKPTLLNYLSDPYGCIIDMQAGITEDGIVTGTGPYQVVSLTSGEKLELKKNETYWDGEPGFDQITVRTISDGDTLTMALQSGEIDGAYGMPYASYPLFENDNYTFSSCATSRAFFAHMNFESPIIQDEAVRKAIAMGIDKEGFVETLLDGNGYAAVGAYPDNFSFGGDAVQAESYDPAGAEKVLEDAGWVDRDGDGIREKDGEKLSIRWLTYPSRQELPLLAEAVQASLKEVGMDVDINCTANRREFLADMSSFDIYASALVTAPSGDPQYFFTTSCQPGMNYNFGAYDNSEVTALIEQLSMEFDTEKRAELAIELQQKILDDHAYIFCSFLQMNMISRSNVKNYTAHACDYYQVTADLDIN